MRLLVGLTGVAVGVATVAVARRHPDASFAGASTLRALAELGAGWALIAAGLAFSERHRGNRFGPLVAGAGFAWFLPEWGANPEVGTALGFTVGLVGFAACPPIVGHAALAYSTGRLRHGIERFVVAISYAGALVLLGLLATTVSNARATGCNDCPRNLVLVHGDAGLLDAFNRYGLRIGLGWLTALGLLLLWRLVRSARASSIVAAPVVASAAAYLAFVAWEFERSLGRDFLGTDSLDRRIWQYEAAALAAFALAVGAALLRERQARVAVARLVVELAQAPRPGAVRDALAGALGDPELELVYRLPQTGTYVDAAGRPVTVEPGPGRTVTPLLRGDVAVAALVHDARLSDRPGLLEETLAAARVAVENEQLQAEVRAQLEELRASRTRIVETADAERRKLERDLHDGAQQRIVTLSLALHLLRAQLGPGADPGALARVGAAADALAAALAELRDVAHGIYPAVLADEGLAAAVETLVDRADVPVDVEGLPDQRFPLAVENTAYFTVAEAVKGASGASVRCEREDGALVIRVSSRPAPDDSEREARLLAIADRVGALGGTLTVDSGDLQAEIPCA